jgi:UDP-glucose 4-epimerase
MKKHILVTGGTGYIGSHTTLELLAADYEVIILDNLTNSSRDNLKLIKELSGKDVLFYNIDLHDKSSLDELLTKEHIDAVIHFAAFKAVGESVENPLKYYDNNVGAFIGFLEVLQAHSIQHFVFSSTAAIYGDQPTDFVTEETSPNPKSPYGWSKRIDEIILHDLCVSQSKLHGVALRYFNVVGAHESGKLGESSKDTPQSLLPIIIRAVARKTPPLTVYGTDYNTPDGTCLRDYIHVVDLAKAHVAALKKIIGGAQGSYYVYNISTGRPTSVMELISAFEKVNEIKVPYTLGPRREGDIVSSYAPSEKAEKELSWKATKTIEDAVRDSWRFYQMSKGE